MTRPVDVRGILERAGANPDAPEGSQAWALAQVDAAVAELIEADRHYDEAHLRFANARYDGESLKPLAKLCAQADIRRSAALARVGGAS